MDRDADEALFLAQHREDGSRYSYWYAGAYVQGTPGVVDLEPYPLELKAWSVFGGLGTSP